jgi:3-oxoacyl-[acyl-carrier protein] reductase
MSGALEGRVAAVAGGAGAIGRAIAVRLHELGARVYSLDLKDASRTEDSAASRSGGIEQVSCDVRHPGSVEEAFAKLQSEAGRVDAVVYAAGITRDAVVWKATVEQWDEVQSVNLRGAFLTIRSAVPLMRSSGGSIVLIGSINGSRGKRGTAAYSASKAGLHGLAKSVARETGRFGITVNVVEPGWVRTPMTESLPQEVRDTALAETLLGEFVEPSDVAALTAFLCSPEARRITGQVIRVDAGQFTGGS